MGEIVYINAPSYYVCNAVGRWLWVWVCLGLRLVCVTTYSLNLAHPPQNHPAVHWDSGVILWVAACLAGTLYLLLPDDVSNHRRNGTGCNDNPHIHGGKNDSGKAIKEESVTEAVKMSAQ